MPSAFSEEEVRDAAKKRLPALVESGDIEKVKAAILDRYGFEPTAAYCRDLIAFVEELTRERG